MGWEFGCAASGIRNGRCTSRTRGCSRPLRVDHRRVCKSMYMTKYMIKYETMTKIMTKIVLKTM